MCQNITLNDKILPMIFTEKLLSAFEINATNRTYSKGDFLIKEGDIERNIYLVVSGAIRVFYISEFEEHTIRLGYTGSLINSLSSFIKETPSEFYIEALRKTQIKCLNKNTLLSLVNENSESKSEYINLLENLVTQQIDREIDLLISS
ncbi:MAG: cyclic nucleotide-binding domain-containing protein [Bacteroidetes bacterium]|nr:cyclic nucleotide-binding domain-containing protein [Bacteroidota bacterium]